MSVSSCGSFLRSPAAMSGAAVVLSYFCLSALPRELDPLAGEYEVSRVERFDPDSQAFVPINARPYQGFYLDIYPGNRVHAGWPRFCGNMPDNSIRGLARMEGHQLVVYDVLWFDGQTNLNPEASFEVRRDRSIVYMGTDDDGRSVRMILRRTRNAETPLDYLGWR